MAVMTVQLVIYFFQQISATCHGIVTPHMVTGMASKGEIGATLPPPAAVPHKRPTILVYPTGESVNILDDLLSLEA